MDKKKLNPVDSLISSLEEISAVGDEDFAVVDVRVIRRLLARYRKTVESEDGLCLRPHLMRQIHLLCQRADDMRSRSRLMSDPASDDMDFYRSGFCDAVSCFRAILGI